ncbi:hypothetical protein AAG570_001343 [Ranatra chinensis]|uniref:Uncharacterized protein n=1 Tax=Ranatra chinensis TaxID=642074 RepID=A0ABD0YBL7_9HEMI
MPISKSTALAHVVLSLSSVWAILNTAHLPYAVVGFSLYFINGILGTFAYGLPDCSLQLYRFYSQLLLWSLSLGLPLFVSQLYVNIGFSHSLALVHFILPVAYIFSGLHSKRFNVFLLETIQILYLAFLLYISLMNGYYYGLSTTVSFAIAFYIIGTTGTVKSTPSRDLFNYALSFSIYFLIQTFNGN